MPGGSFGTIFIPQERRLNNNIDKLSKELFSQSVKQSIPIADPILNKLSQERGRLWDTGSDSQEVLNSIKRDAISNYSSSRANYDIDQPSLVEKKINTKIRNIDKYEGKSKRFTKKTKNTNPLRINQTIMMDNNRIGSLFHPQKILDVYEPHLESKPSESSYNTNSPKMWPIESAYPYSTLHPDPYDSFIRSHTATNSFGAVSHSKSLKRTLHESNQTFQLSPLLTLQPCSKSQPNYLDTVLPSTHKNKSVSHFSASTEMKSPSGLSSLQSTLLECGKLKLVDFKHHDAQNEKVDAGLNFHRQKLLSHARWLGGKNTIGNDLISSSGRTGVAVTATDAMLRRVESHHPDNVEVESLSSQSTFKKQIKASNKPNKVNYASSNSIRTYSVASVAQTAKSSFASLSHTQSVLESLGIETSLNNLNPFRKSHRSSVITTHSRSLPKLLHANDPLQYKDELLVRKLGSNYTMLIKPEVTLGGNPSRSEVQQSLEQMARKSISTYQRRIIETGIILKGLRDIRHTTPGIQAILQLHHRCIQAATFNPNHWLLNKLQMTSVLTHELPWIPSDSIHRFILAYDQENTGLIRYVRMTTALMCCTEPSLQHLSTFLNRVSLKVTMDNDMKARHLDRESSHLQTQTMEREIRNKFQRKKMEDESMQSGGNTSLIKEVSSMASTLRSHTESARRRGEGKGGNSVDSLSHHTEDLDYMGEVLTIRSIHRLYEECAGGSKMDVTARLMIHDGGEDSRVMVGMGMRIEDMKEAFSSCVCNVDDEIRISGMIDQLVETIYHNKQQQYEEGEGVMSNEIRSDVILKHSILKGFRNMTPINADELIDAVKSNPAFFEEFMRQVTCFRMLAVSSGDVA